MAFQWENNGCRFFILVFLQNERRFFDAVFLQSTKNLFVYLEKKDLVTDHFLVLICCIKVFDVIYPFTFDDVKLNKLDANLLDFVAYISVELVVESIGRVCF